MKYVCPLIVVENIEKSVYFYKTILGQTVKADFGENVTFHGDFAIHQKDHYRNLLNGLPITTASHSFELYFEEDDLEPVVEKLEEENIEFIHRMVEQPWKQRVIRFYDYDKNVIEVGESLQHTAFRLWRESYSVEDISAITYLPVEAVKKSIEYFGGKG